MAPFSRETSDLYMQTWTDSDVISTKKYYLSTSTKYLGKKVLKYKYISTEIWWYLSTSTEVPEKYLSTF